MSPVLPPEPTCSIYQEVLLCDLCSADTGGESVESGLEALVDDDRVVAVVVTDNASWAGGGRGEHSEGDCVAHWTA